jgi:FkbM family methyltransferase
MMQDRVLVKIVVKIYAKAFSAGHLAKLNERILLLTLKARGYNNFRDNSESGESFFIEKILAPSNPRLCIDVGANVGNYSAELLQRTSSKVVAFEPHPALFHDLKKLAEKYPSRFVAEGLGIGEKNGFLSLNFSPNALAHGSFSTEVLGVPYVTNELSVEVPVVTLDSYCAENQISEIDFIKIDVEGFEGEVFAGARHVLREIMPRFIQIEFNWHQLFRGTSLNFFSEKLPDYDLFQLVPGGWQKRDPQDPLTNIYHFSNFIFVRRDS